MDRLMPAVRDRIEMSPRISLHERVSLKSGWHPSEICGVWSSARNAVLTVKDIRASGRSGIVLSLAVPTVIVRPQALRVWVGDRCCANMLIDDFASNHFEISLNLSESEAPAGRLEIRLYISSLTKLTGVDGSESSDRPVGVWLNDVWAEGVTQAERDGAEGDERAAIDYLNGLCDLFERLGDVADMSVFGENLISVPGFDEEYYVQRYPEVSQADMGALQHYLTIGWKNGYQPSKGFDGEKYLDINPDVRASGRNPLVHYLQFGLSEGRNVGLVSGPKFGP